MSWTELYGLNGTAYPRWRDVWKWHLARDDDPGPRWRVPARPLPDPTPQDYLLDALLNLVQAAATRPALRAMRPAEYDDEVHALLRCAWDRVRDCMSVGDPPATNAVAFLVMLNGVPDDMRNLVADMLEERVKRPRGRRRASRRPFDRDVQQREVIVHRVFRWKSAIQRQRDRSGRSADPYREALMRVSAETSIPEGTLHEWCYPRQRR